MHAAENYIRPHLPEQAKRTSIGHSVEAYAAVLMRYRGFHVHLNPCRLREANESPDLFLAETDLLVALSPDGPWKRIEVKGKDAEFTVKPESWAFSDVVLYREGKGMRPDGVMFVSTRTWHALGVVANGKSYVSEIRDARRGYSYPVRAVPKSELLHLDYFALEIAARIKREAA